MKTNGQTNGQNSEWVMAGFQYWTKRLRQHPRSQHIKWEVEQFTRMAKDLGLDV